MDDGFRPESTVLSFGPRAHVRVSIKEREYLLWPVWLYQVVAPRIRPRQLNVLQKAALGLTRSGVMKVDEISGPLAIHPDLAALICFELQQKSLLRSDLSITQRGIEVLYDETIDSHEMVTGYVFQDPWSGELWPRFVDRLDYCETESVENGADRILLGSSGKPYYRPAFRVFPSASGLPTAPTSRDIVRAAEQHQKAANESATDLAGDRDVAAFMVGEKIQRASAINDRGEAVFLLTFLYSPSGDGCDGEWHVSDPFGLGSSIPLRRSVEQHAATNRGLGERPRRIIKNSLHDSFDNYRNWIEQVRQDAALTLDSALTLSIRRFRGYDDLLAMEVANKQAELGGSFSQESVRSIATAARRVLEAAFKEIAERFPLQGIWKQCYVSQNGRDYPITDKEFLVAKYNGAAAAVGFATPLPLALTYVKPSQIRAVSDYDDTWRLRPLFMATLLAARDSTDHPLRSAAVSRPTLPSDIENIASMGGSAAHHGSTALGLESVSTLVTSVYRTVGLLTGLAPSSSATAD